MILLLVGLAVGCVLKDFEQLPDNLGNLGGDGSVVAGGSATRSNSEAIAGAGVSTWLGGAGAVGTGSTAGSPSSSGGASLGGGSVGASASTSTDSLGGASFGSSAGTSTPNSSGGNASLGGASIGAGGSTSNNTGGTSAQDQGGNATFGGQAPSGGWSHLGGSSVGGSTQGSGEAGADHHGEAGAGGAAGSSGSSGAATAGSTATVVDSTAPVPGSPPTLSASNGSWKHLTLSWNPATDDVSPSNKLVYQVYASQLDNINSVTAAELNGTLVGSVTNATSATVDLIAGKTNYLIVVVFDEAHNGATYQRFIYTFEEATSCTYNADCYSNTCARYYRDADRDSYGDPDNFAGRCDSSVPSGYVTNNADCCDNGGDIDFAATIFPGQTAWFMNPASLTVNCPHLLLYPFDYDCDGVETQQNTLAVEQPCPSAGSNSSLPYWVDGVVPACGTAAMRSEKVLATHGSGQFCITVGLGESTQYCH